MRRRVSQTWPPSGWPASSPSRAAARPSSSTKPWYSVASSRFRPPANVCLASSRRSVAAAVSRQAALSGNQGNAQLAANCPAISARMWLLADDPWLGSRASHSWWWWSCCRKVRLPSNSGPAPAQPSSSRRIQTQDSSRTPSSMPLVQWMPDRNGLAAHQERSWVATASAYRSSPSRW